MISSGTSPSFVSVLLLFAVDLELLLLFGLLLSPVDFWPFSADFGELFSVDFGLFSFDFAVPFSTVLGLRFCLGLPLAALALPLGLSLFLAAVDLRLDFFALDLGVVVGVFFTLDLAPVLAALVEEVGLGVDVTMVFFLAGG